MNYSITGRFLMLNENGTAREAIGELFVKYPFIMVRMVLAIVLFCAIVVVVSYLKRKTYIHMATELDEITGLINWDRFKKEAEIILKKNPENKYALIHFDIDKFKEKYPNFEQKLINIFHLTAELVIAKRYECKKNCCKK